MKTSSDLQYRIYGDSKCVPRLANFVDLLVVLSLGLYELPEGGYQIPAHRGYGRADLRTAQGTGMAGVPASLDRDSGSKVHTTSS